MSLANDKVSGGRRIIAGNSQLAEKLLASGFKNVIQRDVLTFGSGERADQRVFVGETAPGSNYDSVVLVGDEYILVTFTSGVVSAVAKYVYSEYGWCKYLTSGISMIDASATTALAGTAWDALRVKSKVPAGVTCAGQQSGIYIETEVTGNGICTGAHYGLKIETYVVSTATLSSDHYGIGVFTYDDRAVTALNLNVIRLEHNGACVAGAFIEVQAAANKVSYFVQSSTTDSLWMSIGTTPTCSNVGGWLKMKFGGYTRYVQLWTTIS